MKKAKTDLFRSSMRSAAILACKQKKVPKAKVYKKTVSLRGQGWPAWWGRQREKIGYDWLCPVLGAHLFLSPLVSPHHKLYLSSHQMAISHAIVPCSVGARKR